MLDEVHLYVLTRKIVNHKARLDVLGRCLRYVADSAALAEANDLVSQTGRLTHEAQI
jgi:hypothetical protein